MQQIQWFPGHMAKAKREIKDKLPLIDIIIELRDARIPLSSKNPMIEEIIGNKPRLVLLGKAKMADSKVTNEWLVYYKERGIVALDYDAINKYHMDKIIPYIKQILMPVMEKRASKGIISTQIKGMILGIPNVGKSTLINVLGRRNALKTGNRPGVTKTNTWLKVTDDFILLDTPGILWPKFESEEVGYRLAMCGTIKDELLDPEDISYKAIDIINKLYPSILSNKYGVNYADPYITLEDIARKKGALVKGGMPDLNKAAVQFITDLRNCRLGEMSYERPEC